MNIYTKFLIEILCMIMYTLIDVIEMYRHIIIQIENSIPTRFDMHSLMCTGLILYFNMYIGYVLSYAAIMMWIYKIFE